MNSNKDFEDKEKDNPSINLQEQLARYLYYWKWFVLGVVLALGLAFIYLRYATPVYQANALIMLKDDYRGGAANELSVLSELGIGGSKDNVENEMEVLKSRTLSEKTVERLKLNISYHLEGRIKTTELYKNSPIEAVFDTIVKGGFFVIEGKDENSFKLIFNDATQGSYTYGETIHIEELGSFKIQKVAQYFTDPKHEIIVSVGKVGSIAASYRKNLQVSQPAKFVSVVSLTTVNTHKTKAEDYLNTLVEIYNQDNINDRRYISQKTSDFITQRLEVLVEELSEVESDAEKFKKENQLTDILTQGKLYVETLSEVEKSLLDIDTKISIIDTIVKEFIEKDTRGQTFPMVLDGSSMSAALISAITEHNKWVLHRNVVAASAGPENTDIMRFDQTIEDYKKNIKAGLLQLKSNLEITRSDILKERSNIRGKISTIPTLEKEYRGISRQQGVKE